MATASLKRKNIDIPNDVLRKLNIMAAAEDESLKSFIEKLLVKKADSFSIEVSKNPSPSGDKWFDDSKNLSDVNEAVYKHKIGKSKTVLTLKSDKEIKDFFKNL
jgi:hypothetical protein